MAFKLVYSPLVISGISLPGARWRHILRAPLPALLRLFLISSFYDSSCFSFFYYLLFLRSHVILNKLHATRRYRAEPSRQIRRLRLAAKRRDVFHDETEFRMIRGELINVKSIGKLEPPPGYTRGLDYSIVPGCWAGCPCLGGLKSRTRLDLASSSRQMTTHNSKSAVHSQKLKAFRQPVRGPTL